jgi:hypothetical protein
VKKRFLHWLYRRNEPLFSEFMVEEFYGTIPDTLKTPAMDFLSNAKKPLERFFSIQAYHIQKKSLGDVKNTQFYIGQLSFIKAIINSLSKTSTHLTDVKMEKVDDPIDGVTESLKGLKDFFATK